MKLKGLFLFACFLIVSSVGFSQSTVIYNETFESNGNGIRYFENHTFQRAPGSNGFRGIKANFTDPLVLASNRLNTPAGNNFYSFVYLARDLANSIDTGYVETRWIQITNYDTLQIRFNLAANPSGSYEGWDRVLNRDWVDVDYEIDGSGTWTTLMKFRAGTGNFVSNGPLYRDDNLDNFITGGETTQVDSFFQTFSAQIGPGTVGDSLRFRVNVRSTYLNEDFIIDNLVLRGTPGFVIPTDVPRIIGPNCGFATVNLFDKVWVQPVAGALSYDFRMTMGSTVETVNYTQNRCVLQNFPSIVYDTVVTIDARTITSGGPSDWYSAYYATCQTNIGLPENPHLMGGFCNQTIISANEKIQFERVGLATNYLIRVTRGASIVTDSTNSVWGEFRLTDFGFNYSGNYKIEIAAKIGGVWQSFNGSCNILVSSGDISMVPCGQTLDNANTMLFCQAVPSAVWYRFRVNGPGVVNNTVQRTINGFRLSDISGYSYGNTYTIEVSYRVTSNSAYGPPCNIILDPPRTTVVNQQCGGSVADGSSLVHFFYVPDFDSIQVNYSGPVSGNFVSTNTTNFRFSTIPSVVTGTYGLTVNGYIGGVAQGVGASCNVTLLSFPGAPEELIPEDEIVYDSDFESSEIQVSLSPVPFTNSFKVKIEKMSSSDLRKTYVQLLDKEGHEIQTGLIEGETEINTSNLRAGIYLVKIMHGDQIEVHRVLKQ